MTPKKAFCGSEQSINRGEKKRYWVQILEANNGRIESKGRLEEEQDKVFYIKIGSNPPH